jgi:hypothetical protein
LFEKLFRKTGKNENIKSVCVSEKIHIIIMNIILKGILQSETYVKMSSSMNVPVAAILLSTSKLFHGSISPMLLGLEPFAQTSVVKASLTELLLHSHCIEWTQGVSFTEPVMDRTFTSSIQLRSHRDISPLIINRLKNSRYSRRTLRFIEALSTGDPRILQFIENDCEVLEELRMYLHDTEQHFNISLQL